MNKKIFSALMFLSLLLTGCKNDKPTTSVTDDPNSEQTSEVSEPTTEDSEQTSENTPSEGENSADYDDLFLEDGFELSNSWPKEKINEYLSEHEVSETVPVLPGVTKCFTILTLDDPYFDHYFTIFVPESDRVNDYLAVLEAASYETYTEDDEYFQTVNAEETIQIDIYLEEAYEEYPEGTYIFIEALGENGGGIDVPDVIPVTFDFSSEDQITKRDPNQSIWQADDEFAITMTIDKGESMVDVGNPSPSKPEGYYTDPLRIYAAQVVTFSVPEEFEIYGVYFQPVEWPKGNSVEALTNSAGADVSVETVEGDVLFVLNEPSTSYSFTLFAQARFSAITLLLY